tara:strand:+ start:1245 stop:1811 length:567 start_codon:yes stop_codon:yes gene_type:complete
VINFTSNQGQNYLSVLLKEMASGTIENCIKNSAEAYHIAGLLNGLLIGLPLPVGYMYGPRMLSFPLGKLVFTENDNYKKAKLPFDESHVVFDAARNQFIVVEEKGRFQFDALWMIQASRQFEMMAERELARELSAEASNHWVEAVSALKNATVSLERIELTAYDGDAPPALDDVLAILRKGLLREVLS